jgi:hypothetical protein
MFIGAVNQGPPFLTLNFPIVSEKEIASSELIDKWFSDLVTQ